MSKVIGLTKGKQALIDDADYESASKHVWYANQKNDLFYACSDSFERRSVYLHQFILNYFGGLLIDHVDRNTLNNQRSNLRLCTKSQNLMNRGPTIVNNSTYKGVTWVAKRSIWLAQIKINGKNTFIGHFACPRQAAWAYNHAAKLHLGAFAYLNEVT